MRRTLKSVVGLSLVAAMLGVITPAAQGSNTPPSFDLSLNGVGTAGSSLTVSVTGAAPNNRVYVFASFTQNGTLVGGNLNNSGSFAPTPTPPVTPFWLCIGQPLMGVARIPTNASGNGFKLRTIPNGPRSTNNAHMVYFQGYYIGLGQNGQSQGFVSDVEAMPIER